MYINKLISLKNPTKNYIQNENKNKFENKNFDIPFFLINGNHEILYPKLESVLPIEPSI